MRAHQSKNWSPKRKRVHLDPLYTLHEGVFERKTLQLLQQAVPLPRMNQFHGPTPTAAFMNAIAEICEQGLLSYRAESERRGRREILESVASCSQLKATPNSGPGTHLEAPSRHTGPSSHKSRRHQHQPLTQPSLCGGFITSIVDLL